MESLAKKKNGEAVSALYANVTTALPTGLAAYRHIHIYPHRLTKLHLAIFKAKSKALALLGCWHLHKMHFGLCQCFALFLLLLLLHVVLCTAGKLIYKCKFYCVCHFRM